MSVQTVCGATHADNPFLPDLTVQPEVSAPVLAAVLPAERAFVVLMPDARAMRVDAHSPASAGMSGDDAERMAMFRADWLCPSGVSA